MNPKQQLEQLKRDLETKKFRDGEAKGLIGTIGDEIKKQLSPLFEAHSKEMTSKVGDALSSAVKGLQVNVPETKLPDYPAFPEIKLPDFPKQQPFPKIPAPVVNIPAPIVNIPETVFPSLMKVLLDGVDRTNPLPVLIVDELGKPYYGVQGGGPGGGNRYPYDQNNPMPVTFAAAASQNVVVTGATGTLGAAIVDSGGVAYSGSNPVPVTLVSGGTSTTATNIVDSTGVAFEGANPFPISGNIGTVTTVTGITNSLQSALIDSTGVQYSGSNPVPITGNIGTLTTLTGVTNSIQIVELDRDGNPRQPFTFGAGDGATALRVLVAGDSPASVVVNSGTITTVTTLTGVTNSIQSALIDSGGVQYSGSNPVPITGNIGTVTTVTGITNTLAAMNVDSSGVGYSGSNPLPITGNIGTITTLTGVTNSIQVVQLDRDGNPWQPEVFGPGDGATAMRVLIAGDSPASVVVNSGTITTVTTLTGVTNSIAAMIVDSSSVGYSGSNPMPVTVVSGASTSTLAVGDSPHRSADNGGNPVKVGGISVVTLPTAYADGDRTDFTSDKRGRAIMRPIQVRDLIATAYVSLTTGTEANLLAATAGALYDLVWVLMSNQSTAAVQVDVRPVTAGNVLMTFQVPANGTVGIAPPVPLPGGSDTGNNWTVDMPDITGTTVNITGLFEREI